jgi:hypothetical protein
MLAKVETPPGVVRYWWRWISQSVRRSSGGRCLFSIEITTGVGGVHGSIFLMTWRYPETSVELAGTTVTGTGVHGVLKTDWTGPLWNECFPLGQRCMGWVGKWRFISLKLVVAIKQSRPSALLTKQMKPSGSIVIPSMGVWSGRISGNGSFPTAPSFARSLGVLSAISPEALPSIL